MAKATQIEVGVLTTTEKNVSCTIPRDVLWALIKQLGSVTVEKRDALVEFQNMPLDAKIQIRVPSGWDYSGAMLDVDNNDMQLWVSWTERSVKSE